jgi:hypothetical protein
MRLFLLGDSFTDNLYKIEIEKLKKGENSYTGVSLFIEALRSVGIPDPLYFEDYLRLWGHEVINLGIGGCSNYTIMNQMAKIDKEFKNGDRLIINWTMMSRFDWIKDNGKCETYTGGMIKGEYGDLMTRQLLNRNDSSKVDGHLRNTMVPFMKYLISPHDKYKPIVWSPFKEVSEIFENEKWYVREATANTYENLIFEHKRLNIRYETNNINEDGHYGRYGNFYTALIFNTILNHTNLESYHGYYMNDTALFDKIIEAIKNTKHNLIDFNDRYKKSLI